jgi:hypothetical protein
MTSKAFTRYRRGIASVSAAALLGLMAPAAAPSGASAQVQSSQLGALDLWSSPGRDTGLPPTLWRGASAELVAPVLAAADKPVTPAFAALARRLLATGAAAPEGAGTDPALAAARARALLALGDPEAAAAILARTAGVEASQPLSRAKSEALLALGRDEEACEADRALQDDRGNLWQLRLRAYCHLIAGQGPAAQVTLDLWRQQGGKDAAFDRLAGALAAGAAPAGTKASLSDPLNAALSRRLALDPASAVAEAHPALLRGLSAGQGAAARAAQARALRLGLLSGDEARALYTPPGTPPAPLVSDAAPATEAELASQAAQTADPMVRQQAVGALLKRARTPYEFQALARLVRPRLAELAELKVTPGEPALLVSAAAAAGDAATAQAFRVQMMQPENDAAAALDLALLDAMIAVADGRPAGPVLDRLVERGGIGDPKLRARAQAAALLLAATGQPLSATARAQFAAFDVPAGKATPARLAALARAGAERRTGEAAILGLSITQQQGPGLTVADRAWIVAALAQAGLAEEARALALEGLIALQRP